MPDPVDPLIVDEKTTGFSRTGKGWRSLSSGYDKHSFWVRTRSGRVSAAGKWRTELPSAGVHEVQAKIPGKKATSKKAKYRIKTADGWVKRTKNQRKHRGKWIRLGIFDLTRNPVIKLYNKTGEGGSASRRLAYDAVRFIPRPGAATDAERRAAEANVVKSDQTAPDSDDSKRQPTTPPAKEPDSKPKPKEPEPDPKPDGKQPKRDSEPEPKEPEPVQPEPKEPEPTPEPARGPEAEPDVDA